ncbi:DNA alkylation repair protein [Umezawaea sp. Da 62-37]|uniref:DNA alkylation repair protein n=1 Tax=Umezawaea sp. Da 62-37 TaxID=3075927 RepID=UPI0028F712F6|nr:DNA alkylation repair protein [Umezawaea sp. Da 62-37]WNV88517.1 DNA alkylation repair protein [Umezawaea sp. Da 62-37]
MPTADELLNAAAVTGLARCLAVPTPSVLAAASALDGLGLRERSDLVRDALLTDLPAGFPAFEAVVREALPDSGFTGWMIWPVTEAATSRALEDGGGGAFDRALALLAELTPRLTSEFGIRRLLEADLGRALPIVLTWTAHPDEHVRRLASEGTRPLLPWAKRVRAIFDDPAAAVPVLDALHRDPSEYVRRSVANHLNDISRRDPALAAGVAARWLRADPDGPTLRLVRHGLRTLVKQGHPDALALLGFVPVDGLVVDGPELTVDTVAVGGELGFSYTVENTGGAPAKLAIDYVIHHRKANGSTTAKVFKLTTKTLTPGERLTVTRTHSFRPITTRVYHSGEHAIELQVNGTTFGRSPFALVAERTSG